VIRQAHGITVAADGSALLIFDVGFRLLFMNGGELFVDIIHFVGECA